MSLAVILRRSARLLEVEADEAGIAEIALRSRGTPRIANRLLRRVRDWAQVHGQSSLVDLDAARVALAMFDVDERGLDRLDRAVLESPCRRFGGGPVGLTTLAVAVGEEADTVETVAEPFLVREGFMVRTPRGRAATPLAWEHSAWRCRGPPRASGRALPGGWGPRTPSSLSTSRAASAADLGLPLPTGRATELAGADPELGNAGGWKRKGGAGTGATRAHTGDFGGPGLLT